MARTSTKRRTEPPQLEPVAQQLKAWRATRTPGQRIPEELWKAATELACQHGLSPTVTALKLSYYDLKRRLSGAHRPHRRPVSPCFVELASPVSSAVLDQRATLELVGTSGARLTLRLPNVSPGELLPMVQLFLRHRR